MTDLLPVEEALRRIVSGVAPVETESVAVGDAGGRVLAGALGARRTQPPFAGSSMDGYAMRAADTGPGVRLRLVGESAAGKGFDGIVAPAEAVRIFTGAPLPEGTDAVLPQEQAVFENKHLVLAEAVEPGRYVRDAGIDFHEGEEVLPAGRVLGARELALAASANHATLTVRRRPRVTILSIGDELVPPGSDPGPDQTVAVNAAAIAEQARSAGAVVTDLGIVPDRTEEVTNAAASAAESADVFVTIGGASVGDHDVTRDGLAAAGMELNFWRIAMRPGKPLVFGRLGEMAILGLPGNPVSSFVCGLIFLRPLIRTLLASLPTDGQEPALLAVDMPPNGERAAYLRATLVESGDRLPAVRPMPDQDSSLLTVLTQADCLLVRPAHAKAEAAGTLAKVIRL